MSRRRPALDLQTLKKQRTSLRRSIDRTRDKLLPMVDEGIEACSMRVIERLQNSINSNEKVFFQTAEEAQEFITAGDNQDALQKEEEDVIETFTEAISDVRDMTNTLLSLKKTKIRIETLQSDLRAIRDSFTDKPEADHGSTLQGVEANYLLLRQDWDDADHASDHPLKAELNSLRLLIIKLTAEMAGPKTRPDTSSLDVSLSSHSTRKMDEGKLPVIDLPHFHGDIMEWSTFWAKFVSTVDSKDHLSDTTKLVYLRQAIKDPEAQTMLHSPTEAPGRLYSHYRRCSREPRKSTGNLSTGSFR